MFPLFLSLLIPNAVPTETIAWADVDADGDLDAYVLGTPDGARLMRNEGDAGFLDVTAAVGLDGRRAQRAAWADYDADGRLDLLLVGGAQGVSALLRQTPSGLFQEDVDLALDSAVLDARFADVDGDGRLDLLLSTPRAELLRRNLGQGGFEASVLCGERSLPEPTAVVRGSDAPSDATTSGALPAGMVGGTLRRADTARPTGPRALDGGEGSGTGTGESGSNPPPPGTVDVNGLCAESVRDFAGGACLEASAEPLLGYLYPLSTEFFVASLTGFVGINTTVPTERLQLNGNLRIRSNATVNGSPTSGALRIERIGGTPSSLHMDTDSIQAIGTDLHLNPTNLSATRLNGDGVVVTPSGAVGIDTTTPMAALHVAANDLGVSPAELSDDGILLEKTDAVLGLYSTGGGSFGSTISLGEMSGGSLVDKWSFTRRTSGVGSGLRLTHGTSNQYALNPTLVEFGSDGTVDVEGRIDVTDDEPILSAPVARLAATGNIGAQPVLDVSQSAPFVAAEFMQTHTQVAVPALRVTSTSQALGNYALEARQTGRGSGMSVVITDPAATGRGLDVFSAGSAEGVRVIAANSNYAGLFQTGSGVALRAENTDNSGTIIEAANGQDIEFRVDSGGNVFCDGAFSGGGADYAEWMERLDPSESFQPGDVVAVAGGKLTKRAVPDAKWMVVSTNPSLIGNAASAEGDSRANHEIVAFLGRTPVLVRGTARVGDLLVASGLGDGSAFAIAPSALSSASLSLVIGTAWEAKANPTPARIEAAIGVDPTAAARAVLQAQERRIEALEARLATLEARGGSRR